MRVLLMIALLVAFWFERVLYRERALSDVEVSLRFDSDRTVKGAETDLVLEVTHRGYLPLPWLEIQVPLPAELESRAKSLGAITAILRVPYRATLERRYRIRPALRGYYHLGSVRVTAGDLFGSVQVTEDVQVHARLLVRPDVRDVDLPAREAVRIGLLEHRSLFEDPTVFRGIRDYLPSDPLKRIHWPKTAQLGRLAVREYATAAEYRVCLVTNLAITEPHWRATDRDRVEAVISVAAGIAWACAKMTLPCELWVNAPAFEATALTHLRAGAGSRHLETLLDLMARLATSAAESPVPLLMRVVQARNVFETQGIIFVTAALEPPWAELLSRTSRTQSVTVVLVSDDPPREISLASSVHLMQIPLGPLRVTGVTGVTGVTKEASSPLADPADPPEAIPKQSQAGGALP